MLFNLMNHGFDVKPDDKIMFVFLMDSDFFPGMPPLIPCSKDAIF